MPTTHPSKSLLAHVAACSPSNALVFTPLALALALAAPGSVGTALGSPQDRAAQADADQSTYMPDVQVGEKPAGGRVQSRPLGQEGLGDTTIEIQNRTVDRATLQLALRPRSSTADVIWQRTLGAHGALSLDTRADRSVGMGVYYGQLTADRALGGIARMGWGTGARAAYEAAEPATDIVLPLVARSVYGHYSVLTILNTDTNAPRNEVDLRIYDNATGELVKLVTANIPAAGSTFYDTTVDQRLFGEEVVGINAPTGGWLGALHLVAQRPVVVLAYGDETTGDGSMAYVGQSVANASPKLHLPLVRANYHGNTLIAVANVQDSPVDVTIAYRGAPNSPSGAGQTFRQSFRVTPRGSRYVDLSDRGRSTVPRPDLPSGQRRHEGFVGSAVIQATGPVLAVAQDEEAMNGKVHSLAAYNALPPTELGTAFGVPGWRNGADNLSSTLLVQNPGDQAVTARARILDASDNQVATLERAVLPGSVAGLNLTGVASTRAGEHYRALIDTDGPVAAVLVEEPVSAMCLASPQSGPAHHSRAWADTMIAAAVRLDPAGPAETPTLVPSEPTATVMVSPTPRNTVAPTVTVTTEPPTPERPTATPPSQRRAVYLPIAHSRVSP